MPPGERQAEGLTAKPSRGRSCMAQMQHSSLMSLWPRTPKPRFSSSSIAASLSPGVGAGVQIHESRKGGHSHPSAARAATFVSHSQGRP
eukprot:5661552-Lingulodinium_polyedra.AAC.1